MILQLLLINFCMVLIHESGFITTVDEMIGRKYPMRHLPYPVRCLLCGTWWLSLLYVIIVPGLSLPGVALALLNASVTDITHGLWRIIKQASMKALGWMSDKLQ